MCLLAVVVVVVVINGALLFAAFSKRFVPLVGLLMDIEVAEGDARASREASERRGARVSARRSIVALV